VYVCFWSPGVKVAVELLRGLVLELTGVTIALIRASVPPAIAVGAGTMVMLTSSRRRLERRRGSGEGISG